MNSRIDDYTGIAIDVLHGSGWRVIVHPDDQQETEARWLRSVETGEPYEREQRLRRKDGAWRWHLSRAVLIHGPDGAPHRWIGTNTDIDDQKRVEQALRDSELRLRLSQEAAGIASLEVDITAGEVFGSDTLWQLWGLPPARSVPTSVLEAMVVPEDRSLRSCEASRRDGSAARSVEYRIRRADTGEERWMARHVEFVRDDAGRPVKMFGVMRDVTEAKQSEFRQQILTHELAHRIKNILATVSAIAAQTLRDTDLASARTAFDARLQALGRGHDILNAARWTAASLAGVVEAALDPFPRERITVTGPDVALGPRRALTLALAVNELGTNALKYGALAVDGGRVAVHWRIETTDGAPRLIWSWTETGGPAVAPPERRGFGRFLIERVLAADFGGSVGIEFPSGGVRCLLTAPWPATAKPAEEADSKGKMGG
ncbi:MAG: PAS domain-containing protein [Amaricoccus sp.]|uniref:sensor histidine kinase n=1 Tax=Amaricoccus sp. TaxID=1872485 RepID=UPI0039E2BAA5